MPVVVLPGAGPEQKKQAKFRRNVVRSQLLTQGLKDLQGALTGVAEYRRSKDLEKLAKLDTAAKLMGGPHRLPADARNWLGNYLLGSTEGLPKADDGGIDFNQPLVEKFDELAAKYKVAVAQRYEANPTPENLEALQVTLGEVSKPRHSSELAADKAKNAVDRYKAELDYEMDLIMESGRNARAQLRAGANMKSRTSRYPVVTSNGTVAFVEGETWDLTHPGQDRPLPATIGDILEAAELEETRIDILKKRAEALAVGLGPDKQTLLESAKEISLIGKRLGEDAGPLAFMAKVALAEAHIEDGISPETLLAEADRLGWSKGDEKEQWVRAVAEATKRVRVAPKADKDSAKTTLIKDSIRDLLYSGQVSGMSRNEAIFQIVRALQAIPEFADLEEGLVYALASGVVDEELGRIAEGIPRPAR